MKESSSSLDTFHQAISHKTSPSLPFISKMKISTPNLDITNVRQQKGTLSYLYTAREQGDIQHPFETVNPKKSIKNNTLITTTNRHLSSKSISTEYGFKKGINFPDENGRLLFAGTKRNILTLNTNNSQTNDNSTYDGYNNNNNNTNTQDMLSSSISYKMDNLNANHNRISSYLHNTSNQNHSQNLSQSQRQSLSQNHRTTLHHANSGPVAGFEKKFALALTSVDSQRPSLYNPMITTTRDTRDTIDIKCLTSNSPLDKPYIMPSEYDEDNNAFGFDIKKNNNNNRSYDRGRRDSMTNTNTNNNNNDEDNSLEYIKYFNNNNSKNNLSKTNRDQLKNKKSKAKAVLPNEKIISITSRGIRGGIERIEFGGAAINRGLIGALVDDSSEPNSAKLNKQKNKRKNNEFQRMLAKKSLRSSGFPLRVFINLLRNIKLYYQLIEDAAEKKNGKFNKENGNMMQETLSCPPSMKNISQMQGTFDTLLNEVMNYIENNDNKKHSIFEFIPLKNNANPKNKTDYNPQIILSDHHEISLESKEKLKSPQEMLYCSVQNTIYLIDHTIQNRRRNLVLDAQLKKIITLGQNSGNIEYQLGCLKIVGRIFLQKKDYQGAITILKQYKNIAQAFGNNVNRLKAYKHLGKCYQSMQKYRVALVYYTKLLQLAWHSGNKDYEILAYDLIGMQYYYIGELEKAQYYHEKMMRGQVEENKSIIQLGIQKIQSSHHIKNENNNGNNWNASEKPNNLLMKMHHNHQQKTNIIIEDGIEISSGEEFELPVPDYDVLRKQKEKERQEHEKLFNKKELDDLKKREFERIRNYKAGLARIYSHAQNQKNNYTAMSNTLKMESKTDKNDDKKTFDFDTENPRRKIYRKNDQISTKFTILHNQATLQERIFINHLSRNRGLENFNEMHANIGYMMEPIPVNDQIDAFTAEKIRKLLEKFKGNLIVITNGIEAFFHLQNTTIMDIIDIDNGKEIKKPI